MKSTKFSEIEDLILKYIKILKKNFSVKKDVIIDSAVKTAEKLCNTDFNASNGWLSNFKKII